MCRLHRNSPLRSIHIALLCSLLLFPACNQGEEGNLVGVWKSKSAGSEYYWTLNFRENGNLSKSTNNPYVYPSSWGGRWEVEADSLIWHLMNLDSLEIRSAYYLEWLRPRKIILTDGKDGDQSTWKKVSDSPD